MLDNPQHGFRTTQLDQDLLSAPFRVQTNWHVITGAPCSGKTTLIDLLAEKGFQTVPEVGRQYVAGELAKGRTGDEIREDKTTQGGIAEVTLRIARGLRSDDLVFLDGGFPSSLTYSRLAGLDPNEILADCFHHRYASIFILDRFPFHPNGVRFEDDATAGLLDEWLARDYSALGYRVVRVPVVPPKERLAFVLERLSEQGLI